MSSKPASIPIPALLKVALDTLCVPLQVPSISLATPSEEQIAAWTERQNATLAMDIMSANSDSPSAILLLPANLARLESGSALISAFHQSLTPLLCEGAGAWYVPHALDQAGLKDLLWEMVNWLAISIRCGELSLMLLLSASAYKRSARPPVPVPADNPEPGMRIPVREPGEFHVARFFLPLTFRRADMTIRCRVRMAAWHKPGTPFEGSEADIALYALRWTLGGEHLIFWLRCPAGIPPSIIRTLLLDGSANFNKLSGASLELAGPAAAKGIDPRLGLVELKYEVTVRKQTTAWTIFLPDTITQRLHKLFAEPWEMALLPASGLSNLISLLALNRRLLNRGIGLSLAIPDAASAEDIACALYDRIDALPEHDLTLLVQNHLIPRGTNAILDCFFPRGGFDPLVWSRVTRTLGEKLTVPLALALKEGKNTESGLSTGSLQELVRAVNSRKLELSPRGKRLIGTTLGSLLDGTARKQLQPITDAGLPGVLLAKLPPDERMVALKEMVDRERLIAFLGQRDHVMTLMEGFSSKGKERSLEDFDVLVKAAERGDIESALIIASKNEACCFVARHLAVREMNAWPEAEWKKLQNELSAEELLFFLQDDEKSCFWELPLQAKLAKGLSKDFLKGLEAQVDSQKKSPDWQPKPPAFMHRDLAEKLLALCADDEIIPASKPKPKPRR